MTVVNMVQARRSFAIHPILFLVLGVSVLGGSAVQATTSSDVCAERVGTILVGAGPDLTGSPGLGGLTYKDIDIPDHCFDGYIFLDPEDSSPAIDFQAVCPGGFVRVWAEPGTVLVPFRLVWLESLDGPCKGTGGMNPGNQTSAFP